MDELVPFAIMVNQTSVNDGSVLLRNLITNTQVLLPSEQLTKWLDGFTKGSHTWEEAVKNFGVNDSASSINITYDKEIKEFTK